MRSFEERIAEINRRTEAIQAKRSKRRKQISTVCILLFICTAIAVPLLFLNPQSKRAGNMESVELQEDISDQKNSINESVSTTPEFTSIEVVNLSQSQIYTNQKQITVISRVLYSTIENSEPGITQPDTEGSPPTDSSEVSESCDLLIRMYTGDEIKESYLLSEDLLLVDNKTGKTYVLSAVQAEAIKTTLSEALILVDNKTGKDFELE